MFTQLRQGTWAPTRLQAEYGGGRDTENQIIPCTDTQLYSGKPANIAEFPGYNRENRHAKDKTRAVLSPIGYKTVGIRQNYTPSDIISMFHATLYIKGTATCRENTLPGFRRAPTRLQVS